MIGSDAGSDGNDKGGAREPPRPNRRQWAMLVVFTLSSFLVILNAASLPIPLPSIQEDLGGTLDEITWVFGAFILTFAVFLLPFARLADIYGRRMLLIWGVTVFTLASLAAALTPSMEFLIGALAVQGLGAAMVEPAVRALLKATFPPERQSLAFGVQRAGFFAAAAAGPILSGFLTTVLSWEYVFWLNVAVGVVVLAGAVPVIPESRAQGVSRRLDWAGLLLGAAGIFFLVFPIIEGTRLGWGSPSIVGSFAASVVLLALFVVTETRVWEPLVDLTMFKDRLFAVGNFVRGATEFASLGIFFALSHFLQAQLGYSALVAGLLLMSIIVGALITSPIAETLSGRVDVRLLVIPGFVFVAAGTFWVAHVSPETGWAFFIAPLAIAGAGFGALESPTETTMHREVPPARSEIAWCVSYGTYLLGIGLGVAVVSGVLQSQFVANAKDALSRTDLPPGVGQRISSSLFDGGVSGQPAARIGGPGAAQVEELIQGAFAKAVNTALLSCVAVALLGALVALSFSSGLKEGATDEEGASEEQIGRRESD